MSYRESPGDGNSSVDTTMTPLGKRIAVVPFPSMDTEEQSPPSALTQKPKTRVAENPNGDLLPPPHAAAANNKSPGSLRLDIRMRQKVSELEAEVDRLSAKLRAEELATHQANLEVKKLRKEKDHNLSGSLNASTDRENSQRVDELLRANKQLETAVADLQAANKKLEKEVENLQGLLKQSSLAEVDKKQTAVLEEQVQQLKDMLVDRDAAIASQKSRISALTPKAEESSAHSEELGEVEQRLRAQLKTVMEDNRLMNEELDRNAAELGKLEHRLARGEYNAELTQIVRPLAQAPCTHCVGLRAELASVKAERDAAADLLSKAGAGSAAEKAEGEEDDDGGSLESGLKIAELHKQLAEKDKYILRLSEMAKTQIQEYKEVAKALFGFSLSKHKAANNQVALGQYQVRSLFATGREDVLLVHAQEGGRQVDMLSTSYSVRMKEHADLFFQQAHLFPPLPALLASITIEHYARITAAPDP